MLYRIFKFLFYFTTRAYFRSLYIKNKEVVPAKGPVVFAVNHTSAFMDPILLATHIKRQLYFLSRGDAFKSGFSKWLFPKLHMIPVYRPDLFPNDTHKNKQVFEKCFEHLENKKTVMIFPEGISETVRRLRPIKTGISRISLVAEERNNFELGVVVIPIGINYSNPHHFKSDVFVKFGDPIDIKDYKDRYFENKKQTVLELTEDIKSSLEKVTVNIENKDQEKIIQQIEVLYRSRHRETKTEGHKAPIDFYLSQDIVTAVSYFSKNKPEQLKKLEEKMTSYLTNLKRLGIRDTQIRNENLILKDPKTIFYFIFGFPFFLYGYIFNFIPFKSAEILAKKILVRADFVGSMKLGLGMFIFLICYVIMTITLGVYTNFSWSILFLLTLYPVGLFTINYIKEYFQVRGSLKFLFLKNRKKQLIQDLKVTRKNIVHELESGKTEFENYLADQKK